MNKAWRTRNKLDWLPRDPEIEARYRFYMSQRLGREHARKLIEAEVAKAPRRLTLSDRVISAPITSRPMRPSRTMTEMFSEADLLQRGVTAVLMGDPLPGRSALDRRRDRPLSLSANRGDS